MAIDSPFIEGSELASTLGIRVKTLRFLARKGSVPSVKIGRKTVFSKREILDCLKRPESSLAIGWARASEAEGLIEVILERERLRRLCRRKGPIRPQAA